MGVIICKELKKYFTGKVNLLFIFLMPILFVTFFSYALENYINSDYDTFKDGKIFYYSENLSAEYSEKFTGISEKITLSTGVVFEEVSDLKAAKNDVEKSKAYAVISINSDGFDYFRSEFNEPVGGEIIRSMFLQLSENFETFSDGVMIIENNMNIKKPPQKFITPLQRLHLLFCLWRF